MQIDVPTFKRTSNSTRRASLVNNEGIDAFKSVFNYQKYMLSRILWASTNSVIRIVPGNDGTNLYQQNINNDNWQSDVDQLNYLSDTFYMTRTVTRFGDSKMEFISNLRPGSEEASMYPESPINYFCSLINRTMQYVATGKKTRVKWIDAWKSWVGMNGTVPYPRSTLFMQAICMTVNGRPCKSSMEEDAQEAPLFGLIGINHRASINALVKALVGPMSRNKPLGPENNDFGALAEANGNLLFLNTALDQDQHKYLAPSVQDPSVPANRWEPTPYDLSEDICKALWVPWDKLLKYMTVEEQLELISAEFGPDTVNYIFSIDEAWSGVPIPDDIRKYGMGRYDGKAKVSVPGGSFVPPQFQKAAPVNYSAPKQDLKVQPQMASDVSAYKDQLAKIKAATEKKQQEPTWNPPNSVTDLANDLTNLDGLDDLGDLD